MVDHARGYVKIGENVGWQNVTLKETLEKELGLPTGVDTDAFCGGLAEARLGSGQALEHFLYVVIGSGIGMPGARRPGLARSSRRGQRFGISKFNSRVSLVTAAATAVSASTPPGKGWPGWASTPPGKG
ncbi:MAG: ROK family protein [Anaerolineae bacterium]